MFDVTGTSTSKKMKVYLLVEITDYDCTDEETILYIYSNEFSAKKEKERLEALEEIRVEKAKSLGLKKYPYQFIYEVREYEVIE